MINIYKSTPHSPSSSFGFRLNIWLCTYPTATSGCRFSGALSGLLSVIPLPRPQHLCLSASIRAKQELICLVIDSHSYHLAIILHINDINGVAPNPPRFSVYTLHCTHMHLHVDPPPIWWWVKATSWPAPISKPIALTTWLLQSPTIRTIHI